MQACNTSPKSDVGRDRNVQGIYVREQTVEVRHPESGDVVGNRRIQDSIFVEPVDGGFSVRNKKWHMKDYDNLGWVSMEHAEDRPFKTFVAELDEKSNILQSENGQSFTIDENGRKLIRTGKTTLTYTKVRK